MKTIFIVCTLFALFNFSVGIDFLLRIPKKREECFSEFLTPNTMVVVTVTTEPATYKEIAVNVYDSDGTSYFPNPHTGPNIKLSFTTSLEGETKICMKNRGNLFVKLHFELLSGFEAGDASQAASDEDLKPIEKHINSIQRTIQNIKTTAGIIVKKEEEQIVEADSFSTQLYICSAVTVIALVILSVAQLKYYERSFRAKKLI